MTAIQADSESYQGEMVFLNKGLRSDLITCSIPRGASAYQVKPMLENGSAEQLRRLLRQIKSCPPAKVFSRPAGVGR